MAAATESTKKKLSTGEFLFGPKKPKLKTTKSAHKRDIKRHKEKHARSLPGKLQKGFKMVFGKKVKVKEARELWRVKFAEAFEQAELSEDVAVMVFEQAYIDEGYEITEELLEDVFVGLLSHIETNDIFVVDEAIDELVEELWLERAEKTKEFVKKVAKKGVKAAKKHGKEAAKSVGLSVAKAAAGELDKTLKSAKTKKGSVKHALKHAARGALKQIAKDPKKAKQIAKKSLKKLAKKGAKAAVKKGLKMVFGKWVKVEDATVWSAQGSYRVRSPESLGKKAPKLLKPEQMVQKYGSSSGWFIDKNPDGSKNKVNMGGFKTKKLAMKQAWGMIAAYTAKNGYALPSGAPAWVYDTYPSHVKEALVVGKTSFDVPPPGFRKPGKEPEKYEEAERLITHIRLKYSQFKDIYWDTYTGSTRSKMGMKSVWIGLRDNRDTDHHSKRLEELFKLLKKLGWTSRRTKREGRTVSLIARPKAAKEPKKKTVRGEMTPGEVKYFTKDKKVAIAFDVGGEEYMALTYTKSKNFRTYDGAMKWLRRSVPDIMDRAGSSGKHSPSAIGNRPKSVTLRGAVGKVWVDFDKSELRPSLPVSVSTGLQGGGRSAEYLHMRQEYEHLATGRYGAPPAGVWTWIVGDKSTKGGDGKTKPKWKGGMKEWLEALSESTGWALTEEVETAFHDDLIASISGG